MECSGDFEPFPSMDFDDVDMLSAELSDISEDLFSPMMSAAVDPCPSDVDQFVADTKTSFGWRIPNHEEVFLLEVEALDPLTHGTGEAAYQYELEDKDTCEAKGDPAHFRLAFRTEDAGASFRLWMRPLVDSLEGQDLRFRVKVYVDELGEPLASTAIACTLVNERSSLGSFNYQWEEFALCYEGPEGASSFKVPFKSLDVCNQKPNCFSEVSSTPTATLSAKAHSNFPERLEWPEGPIVEDFSLPFDEALKSGSGVLEGLTRSSSEEDSSDTIDATSWDNSAANISPSEEVFSEPHTVAYQESVVGGPPTPELNAPSRNQVQCQPLNQNWAFEYLFNEIVASSLDTERHKILIERTLMALSHKLRRSYLPETPRIQFEELSPLFMLTRSEVSRRTGLCLNQFKRIIRQAGIARWPSRKYRQTYRKVTHLTSQFQEKIGKRTDKTRKRSFQSHASKYNMKLLKLKNEAFQIVSDLDGV
uniref:RWP-RK domain-containing protein n=1 Tax=Rhodosorus marinus TaxID=101924 RepID=A0A7S2ZAV7_9RHOD|mmetsp:Transcript_12523/g.50929  ORF Transcript_12523/g.50929 Transcript_12523/m.50929 type:complete len:478 (+) Transcript_12523:116-1549(+)